MRKLFLIHLKLLLGCLLLFMILNPPKGAYAHFQVEKECFCKPVDGDRDDIKKGMSASNGSCKCSLHSVDTFNNEKVFPLLNSLLQRDFFKFYKINMERPCPFWPDDRQCSSKECSIGYCDDEVPPAFRLPVRYFGNSNSSCSNDTASKQENIGVIRVAIGVSSSKQSTVKIATTSASTSSNDNLIFVQMDDKDDQSTEVFPGKVEEKIVSKKGKAGVQKEECESSNRFDPLDRSLSEGDKAQLRDMDIFEEEEYNFCDIDDERSGDMHYVNLLKNPERYTGYKGDSAVKVWQSIYQENCFKPDPKFDKDFILNPTPTGMCLEKRVFYRLISGLHTAITVSIASHNYKPAPAGFGEGTWFRNFEMFKGRFGTKWFGKEGPERLKNLYFAYMLELRALVKVAPYMQKGLFYTGNDQEDAETRQSVDSFMDLIKSYPEQFDETQLFTGYDARARSLREEFRQHFVNVSRIMDCVGCDKCRLWGKLQIHGMGTALKILFSDLPLSTPLVPTKKSMIKDGFNQNQNLPYFKLTRNEVVALFQSFGRYASSIWEINEFRQGMSRVEIADVGI